MNSLLVHKVDIAHYRLIELIKLADQAQPFYDWVEKIFRRVTHSHRRLPQLLLGLDKIVLRKCLSACYLPLKEEALPILFDGVGRSYKHETACFYFFSWLIRDAPKQRLEPLIANMVRGGEVKRLDAQLDALTELYFAYRGEVQFFGWEPLREIIVDRLEGSRRSLKGHYQEAFVRTAFVTATQNYFAVNHNYGRYQSVAIESKQVKVGQHSFDVVIRLTASSGTEKMIYVPVKSRETRGGGHAHLFTRDISSAIHDVRQAQPECFIVVVVVADNWSATEIESLNDKTNMIFHFNLNPNQFQGFDESSQLKLNELISLLLQ